MSRVRLDVEFRTDRVRNAIVYEVTIQDIRHLGCLFVQVPRNLAPRLHSQDGHCWTKGLITIQYFEVAVPFVFGNGAAMASVFEVSTVCIKFMKFSFRYLSFLSFLGHGPRSIY